MYEFKPQFLTGIKVLDDEHKKIFALTDEAYYLLKNENILFKQEEVNKILEGIREYTYNHFADEEAYMEKINFPELGLQKKQHKKFAQKLEEISRNASDLSLTNQDEMLLELLDYLVDWLERHILESDMKYKQNK